jgi:hypothetical protein
MRPGCLLLLLVACKADPVDSDSDPVAGDTDPTDETDEPIDTADTDCDELAWRPDADGDGFGDASASPVQACEAPVGHVEDATDCDDADPAVNPAAAEICNGKDDDCVATGEDRLAWWERPDGTGDDVSDELLAGSWMSPVTWVLEEPGTLHLCGKFTASLRLRADVDVVGHDRAELSGGGATAPVVVRRPVDVSIADVVLSDGVGVGIVNGELTAGGGLECADAATVTLTRVTVERSTAEVGAGIYAANGCALTVADSTIDGNDAGYYGGGVAVIEATATITDSTLANGTAGYGGGIAVVGGSATLTRTTVEGNDADQGGGALVESASLSCEADPSEPAGFFANTALEGADVYLDLATLESAGCDPFGDLAYDCTTAGCTP